MDVSNHTKYDLLSCLQAIAGLKTYHPFVATDIYKMSACARTDDHACFPYTTVSTIKPKPGSFQMCAVIYDTSVIASYSRFLWAVKGASCDVILWVLYA